jgi:hypothetical protein
MRRGYTLLWRKIWANSLLCDPGKKFSRLKAWLHIFNVMVAGMDDEEAGLPDGTIRAQATSRPSHEALFARPSAGTQSGGGCASLRFVYYNSVRIHQTLRVTPAMEAGIMAIPMSVGDIVLLYLRQYRGKQPLKFSLKRR